MNDIKLLFYYLMSIFVHLCPFNFENPMLIWTKMDILYFWRFTIIGQ